MRIPRTHVDGALAVGDRIALAPDIAHHWSRVLRLAPGASVQLFNGTGGDWNARLTAVSKQGAEAEIESFVPRATESALPLTLVQGISRGQRMDYTLEKAVELGVQRVVPVVMARSHAAPPGDRLDKKTRHWSGVIKAAASQSYRTSLPRLDRPIPFAEWVRDTDPAAQAHVLLDPAGDRAVRDLGEIDGLTLVAGPEGGFSPSERREAGAAGCHGLSLGPRVLRTETAAVAALAAVQAVHGDLV